MRPTPAAAAARPNPSARSAVALAEVADPERVHEVVGRVASRQGGRELGFVGHVDGARLAAGELAAVAGERDDVVARRDQLGASARPTNPLPPAIAMRIQPSLSQSATP